MKPDVPAVGITNHWHFRLSETLHPRGYSIHAGQEEIRMTERLELINAAESTAGTFDSANFAGQGTATNRIGVVFHHYTDSPLMQVDNVGSNTILTLKNAHNPVRRPDKASDYVGAGNFLALTVHDHAAGFARSLFQIDQNGRLVWTGATRTAGTGGTARLLANKTDDGGYAYAFDLTHKHQNVANMFGVFEVRNDMAQTRAVFRAMTAQTNGMMFDTVSGPLTLNAGQGGSYVQLGGNAVRFGGNHEITTTAGAVVKYLTVQDSVGGQYKIPLHAMA